MISELSREYTSILKHCFINAPFDQLQSGLLELFIENRIQPEIGLEGECLWNADPEEFKVLANTLRENDLQCTLHAPFFDLAPGGIDSRVLETSREKLRRAFQLLEIFQPRSIVCHLGYDMNKHSYKHEQWLQSSVATWTELLELAALQSIPVMFENTYETTPDIHQELFERLQMFPNTGFCLDVGHLSAYAGTGWHLWLETLLPRLKQLHLHDNRGGRDDHLAIGEGNFGFDDLFLFLSSAGIHPLVTLEPHSEKDLWLSLQKLASMDSFAALLLPA